MLNVKEREKERRKDSRNSKKLTKPICILHPILAVRRIDRSGVDVDVIEAHVLAIHDIQAPQLRVLDVEIVHAHFRRVPEHKRHWPAWLGIASFGCIPGVSIAINTAGSVSVDSDIASGNNESSCVVLECDRVGVVPPVFKIVRELGEGHTISVIFLLLIKSLLTIHSPRHSISTL